jgi:hypothetical protein
MSISKRLEVHPNPFGAQEKATKKKRPPVIRQALEIAVFKR